MSYSIRVQCCVHVLYISFLVCVGCPELLDQSSCRHRILWPGVSVVAYDFSSFAVTVRRSISCCPYLSATSHDYVHVTHVKSVGTC